jgi:tRNA pseudouridine38-40 synthase
MKKVALKIAYIGTNFHGFQRQPNHRTVEGEIIYTLRKLGYIDDLDTAKFGIAGRTDRGVHSLGNVISFISEKEVIINQINNKLPEDIQIIAKAPVRYGFKPRYAQCKHYRYIFYEKDLNIEAMRKLATVFKGRHDFTNFSKRSQKSPIRTIDKITITLPENSHDLYSQKSGTPNYFKSSLRYSNDLKESGDFTESHYVGELKSIGRFNKNFEDINFNESSYAPVFIDIYGESFLWNMIRKMMRIFLFVGKNEMEVEDVEDMFNPNAKYNIKALDPENLILMDIEYDKINFQYDTYALEGFKRTLIQSLFDYKIKLSMENSILNSIETLKSNKQSD